MRNAFRHLRGDVTDGEAPTSPDGALTIGWPPKAVELRCADSIWMSVCAVIGRFKKRDSKSHRRFHQIQPQRIRRKADSLTQAASDPEFKRRNYSIDGAAVDECGCDCD
jgi:hypothetical protein